MIDKSGVIGTIGLLLGVRFAKSEGSTFDGEGDGAVLDVVESETVTALSSAAAMSGFIGKLLALPEPRPRAIVAFVARDYEVNALYPSPYTVNGSNIEILAFDDHGVRLS